MEIELITTGSELLLGFTVNRHLDYVGRQLAASGLRLTRHTTVADDRAEMTAVVREALGRSDFILITGGLGPTSDDFTRDVVAELLELPLVRDETVAVAIADRFRRRSLPMPDSVNVQALVPRGARVLPNRHGTAPGLLIERTGKKLVLLPGPPRELQPMFEEFVVPLLPHRRDFDCRVLRTTGLPESIVEQKVAPVVTGVEIGYCARPGEVDVRIIGPTAAEAEQRVRAALGDYIYGTGDDRLEEVVIKMLAGKTVATAESCTGGLIANRLTNVSGSSAVFLAGWVTYSNAAKMRDLGVREETLQAHGAVSEQVCREMAEGSRQRSGANFALSATGIAGPTGGTSDKLVGLVWIGLATPNGTKVQRHVLAFDRETFKWFVSQSALELLRRELLR
jgi:nicotinamide-nucleotide amidase